MTKPPRNRILAISKMLLPPAMIAVCLVVVPKLSQAKLSEKLPLQLPLPESFASWSSTPVSYCQDSDCPAAQLRPIQEETTLCPECGHEADSIPFAEKQILPPDTLHFRRRYIDEKGQVISVIVLVSGESRSSFHKPEYCLPGQGLKIFGEAAHTVDMGGKPDLETTLLDISSSVPGQGGQGLFIYWFDSPVEQTGSQVRRNWLMIKERLLHGKITRWAYVTVLAPYQGKRETSLALIESFLRDLYPQIKLRDQKESSEE